MSRSVSATITTTTTTTEQRHDKGLPRTVPLRAEPALSAAVLPLPASEPFRRYSLAVQPIHARPIQRHISRGNRSCVGHGLLFGLATKEEIPPNSVRTAAASWPALSAGLYWTFSIFTTGSLCGAYPGELSG